VKELFENADVQKVIFITETHFSQLQTAMLLILCFYIELS